jgi:hypothetical protein
VQFNNGGSFAGSAGLVWDNTNKRLGVGTASPGARLDVSDTQALRLTAQGGTNHTPYMEWMKNEVRQAYMGWGVPGSEFQLAVENGNALSIQTQGTEKMRVASNGNVGIGVMNPSAALEVMGSVVSRAFNAGSATSINWLQGNSQYTSANCGAFSFSNMLDGGHYVLAVQGTSSGTCSFSHSGLTFRMPPEHSATTAGQHALYAFNRMGSFVYVSWINGM